jgi:diadenosine tetraphosphate (Ap4A) HIT family hydrolase
VLTIYDKYPVNPGHVLVVSKRHVEDYFDLTGEEVDYLLKIVASMRSFLEEEYDPQGFNVGFNVGEEAGQTIDHVHIHIIPRYVGDMDNPTGGVRHVIPERGRY